MKRQPRDYTAESENCLVENAQKGDIDAFGELIERNQDLIYNSINCMIFDPEQAEDLTQTVFLKALKNITSFEKRSSFSTWLYSIMINTVRSFRRSGKKHTACSIDNAPGPNSAPLKAILATNEPEPWEKLRSKENIEAVRTCIKNLEPAQREIIVLRDMEGLTYNELASVLDISLGTVKSRLSRSRNALKQKLVASLITGGK